MKLLEAIQKSTEFLHRKGVDSARLDSELLLAHLLGVTRLKLYLRHEEQLSPGIESQYRELIKRRGTREPLQHLVGTVNFCGTELFVSGNVLIPRQETELLAEQGWLFLQKIGGDTRLLDVGTGSGCLAIGVLKHVPSATGQGVDISPAALEVARKNALEAGVQERLEIIQSDLFSALKPDERFDLILSNPPYIPDGDIPGLQAEVRDHDPRVALAGGEDGLKFYRILAEQAGRFLRPKGKMMLEFGDGQEKPIETLLQAHNWIVEKILPDYSGRARMVIATLAA